ncbi:GIN domain-containing protein [Pedobacter lusitanus]|uniref:GIN domain-containing protein n=1 Tax=Pedobacter lusitanus TaxID=1503925 RepID=UPI0032AF86E3
MKTSFKTLAVSAMTAIILSGTVFGSFASEKSVASAKVISFNDDIKRVVVMGNTKVSLVQSSTEFVSIDEGEREKVSIKQMGNTLTVSSSEETPVKVTIYVKDVYRIYASDNASVRTVGTFKQSYLQVILRDHAVAYIKAKTESMYTDLDGEAYLDLSGATDNHTIKNAGIGSLKTERFAASKTENLPVESRWAMNGAAVKKTNTSGVRK